MKSTNSTDNNAPDTLLAEEMVRASVSRFESAMDQLAEKVEHTGLTVRHALDIVQGIRNNPRALLFGLTGILGGIFILRLAGHRLARRRAEARDLIHTYPEGHTSTWVAP